MAWILRLVRIGTEGENQSVDVMTINRPDDLGDIATLRLTLAEGKPLLAGLQQEIVAAQARGRAARRLDCRSCGLVCRVKDYREHRIATLFGQVTVRLPQFYCAGSGGHEAGHGWPSHCRSTPELDQIQAHLAALMTYRVAADVPAQMFPVSAGNNAETLRCHTLNIGEGLRDGVGAWIFQPNVLSLAARFVGKPINISFRIVDQSDIVFRADLASVFSTF